MMTIELYVSATFKLGAKTSKTFLILQYKDYGNLKKLESLEVRNKNKMLWNPQQVRQSLWKENYVLMFQVNDPLLTLFLNQQMLPAECFWQCWITDTVYFKLHLIFPWQRAPGSLGMPFLNGFQAQ